MHLPTVTFDSMGSAIFSLLQQVLEGEAGLKQAMETAMKLCVVRLAGKRSQKVPLKTLVDVR